MLVLGHTNIIPFDLPQKVNTPEYARILKTLANKVYEKTVGTDEKFTLMQIRVEPHETEILLKTTLQTKHKRIYILRKIKLP